MPQSPEEQKAIVQRMIDAGETEENIATVIQHFQTQTPDPTEGRSAASRAIGGVLTGSGIAAIPDLVGTALTQNPYRTVTDLAKGTLAPLARLGNVGDAFRKAGFTGGMNELAASIPILGPAAEHASERMKSGDTAGGIGEIAGMVASPFLGEGAAKTFPAVKAAFAARGARTAASAANDAKMAADLIKAVPPPMRGGYSTADVQKAAPYLASEHAASPIVSVEGLRDAANSAITQVEEHVASYIDAHPRDMIRTSPLASAQRALANSERSGDMAKGMAALRDLGLDQPLTLAEADAKRLRLNAENTDILKQSGADVSNARTVDPTFAAREAASEALRNGIYEQLESRGISGVRQLRQDEGALIKIRNSANRLVNAGDRPVGGTGKNTLGAKVARVAATGAGAAAGSPFGAIGSGVGAVLGSEFGKTFAPANLTRDALIERAFSKVGKTPVKTYPSVPPDAPIAGQLAAPATPLPTGRPDASFARGVPAMAQPPNAARMIEAPKGRPMGPKPDTSGVTTIPARGIVVRDPKTGRFKRVFTTEGTQ